MSIIYNTLERLEKEGAAKTDSPDQADTFVVRSEPKKSPVKAVVTVMVLVFVGTGFFLWQGNEQSGGPSDLSFSSAASQDEMDIKSDHQLTLGSDEEQTVAHVESIQSLGEGATSGDQIVEPAEKTSTGLAEQSGNQGVTHNEDLESASETLIASTPNFPQVKTPANSLKSPTIAPEIDQLPTLDSNKSSTDLQVSAKPAIQSSTVVKSKPVLLVHDKKQQQRAESISSANRLQSEEIEVQLEKARISLSRGQYNQALSALEALSQVPVKRADFWLIKGSVHLGLGQLDLAERAFESAHEVAPDNAHIAIQRAILSQERDDHANALQILNDAASMHPNVPEIFLNQGYSQQALGEAQDAGRSFRVFLRITEGRSLYAEQRKVVNQWLAQISSIPG